ncbi:hypothetical protein Trydic_g6016 [Trypoxylus dichotomus]
MWKSILLLTILAISARGLHSDDKFLKKYALIKIFESCFGQEVVKEIRKELKAACMKCQGIDGAAPVASATAQKPIGQHKLDVITEPENTLYANQQIFPTEKLHQAILAFRPNSYSQLRPYGGTPASFYQPFASPVPLFYNPNYSPNSFVSSPYGLPYFNQPFYSNSRMSREMDMRSQWESLMPRLSSRVKNITCVMHELGYIDDNLEPNYPKISQRIAALPVPEELRKDIQDGVTYCQQFSQCIPEPKKEASPLSRELTKPMLFFKCYKYKKLEACIMKDVREKISNISEDDFDGDTEFRRTGKSMKHDEDSDDLASTMYDFLYGTDTNFELDNMF